VAAGIQELDRGKTEFMVGANAGCGGAAAAAAENKERSLNCEIRGRIEL